MRLSNGLIACSTHLSRREQQVAELIAEGLPRKQIAHRLQLANGSIDSLAARAAEKIGGRGRPAIRITRFILAQGSTGSLAA